ncbi:MAG: phage tail protein [Clostridiales bacterium]|nr:phage tail protein [Clostridiales bacterium]
MTIRLPRLLDEGLREVCRLSPVRLSLTQRLMNRSTAELLLPPGSPETPLRALIELYDEHGSAGVFRVKEVSDTLGHLRKVTLEHSLCTLRDSMLPAQGFTDSVRGAIARILDCQELPLWTVGEVEAPEDLTIVFSTEYADLLRALEALVGMLPEGYALDFDQSVTPWLLHLRQLTDAPFCEGRLSRNLQSVRVDRRSNRLCTRVYPFGAEVDTGRVSLVPLTGRDYEQSEAAAALGVVSRTFENDKIFDAPTLQDVARLYLARHAAPEVTITVSAADLSAATGEAVDRFRPGRMCRLCLPEMGMTLLERIIAVHRPDVYGAPGQVQLTLANYLRQLSESAEVDELVRQVTTGKLLGGKMTEIVLKNRAYGALYSPVVHYFDIEDWAAVLDVHVHFSVDRNATMRSVRVDATYIDNEVWKTGSFSAMPYLQRNDLGQIARGQHKLLFYPYGSSADDECGVNSEITLTVITNTVT